MPKYTGETLRLHTEDYTEDYHETHYHITLIDEAALRYLFQRVLPRFVAVVTASVVVVWIFVLIDLMRSML